MNYISLFFVCKVLMCTLYSVAAAVLVYDTSKTYKKSSNQLFRRRMLALSFVALSVLYSIHLVVFNLFPQLFAEENYVTILVLLALSVFPILSYLFRMVSGNRALLPKISNRWSMALLGCIIVCYVMTGLINQQWFCTLTARFLGGLIWICQISFQGYMLYKIEDALKSAKHFDRYIRVFSYFFNALGVATFPILFLFPDSVYWRILQLVLWSAHCALFFYILRKDALIVTFPPYLQPHGLLLDSSPIYHADVDTSMFGNLYERLLDYFKTEKPYLKSGINVGEVAIRLSSNKSYLSRLLNDKLNQNFNQFVNTYRVKEAQRMVSEKGMMSLQELCKKVGFTSMATFTVAFKLNTGMTPGEWCKKQARST